MDADAWLCFVGFGDMSSVTCFLPVVQRGVTLAFVSFVMHCYSGPRTWRINRTGTGETLQALRLVPWLGPASGAAGARARAGARAGAGAEASISSFVIASSDLGSVVDAMAWLCRARRREMGLL